MKKKQFLLISFLLVFNLSFGQNNMEDVVYLKNGSIIRGTIIEQIPNKSIKIQTKDRRLFVFKFNEIEKFTKENLISENPPTTTTITPKIKDFKKKGYINITEINYNPGTGSSNSGNYTIGFKTVNGYQLNEHLSLGIGLGIDGNKNQTLLPITADIRGTILKGILSPVINMNVGYSLLLNAKNNYYGELKGGLVINPSFGIKTYISQNVAFLFNIGYKMQWQTFDYNDVTYGTAPSITTLYPFLTFNAGFSF